MGYIVEIVAAFRITLTEMAPYLLFGFFVAGVVSVLVSAAVVERHLGGLVAWAAYDIPSGALHRLTHGNDACLGFYWLVLLPLGGFVGGVVTGVVGGGINASPRARAAWSLVTAPGVYLVLCEWLWQRVFGDVLLTEALFFLPPVGGLFIVASWAGVILGHWWRPANLPKEESQRAFAPHRKEAAASHAGISATIEPRACTTQLTRCRYIVRGQEHPGGRVGRPGAVRPAGCTGGGRKADGMGARIFACAAALAVMTAVCPRAAGGIAVDHYVEAHAASQGLMTGDRWQESYGAEYEPAVAEWPGVSSGEAEFGANRTASFSEITDDRLFAYAYADASWLDTVTIYDPWRPVGDSLDLLLHFNLSGGLFLGETGTQPPGTTVEARAAVSADVKSVDLGIAAHGYNMLTYYGDGVTIMRQSGGWDLGGAASTPTEYTYCDDIVLPALVPNGVPFDLLCEVAVATHSKLSYLGEGEFAGLGGYGLTAEADFSHSMILGVFTDASGRPVGELGYLLGSEGATFGAPLVIPEPLSLVLFATGMAAAFAARRRRKAA